MSRTIAIADLFDRMTLPDMAVDIDDVFVPIGFLNDLNLAQTKADILQVYANWAKQIVGADRCSIGLHDDAEGLVITAMNGAKGTPFGANHPIDRSVIGNVFQRRKLLMVPDLSQVDLPDALFLNNLGFRCLMLAPIVSGTDCFGVLNAAYVEDPAQRRKKLALLQAIAHCLATQIRVITQMDSLKQLSQTDPLTKMGNRNQLYESMEHVWQSWTENKTQSAFIMLDLDHFKRVNDTYGHSIGDDLLLAIANRLKSSVRATDCVVRTGGEEFGVILRATEMESALATAQRILNSVGRNAFVFGAVALDMTVSIGVSRIEDLDQDFEDMIKRSDRALYKAKEAGRDQIFLAQDDRLVAA